MKTLAEEIEQLKKHILKTKINKMNQENLHKGHLKEACIDGMHLHSYNFSLLSLIGFNLLLVYFIRNK
jgi:hypothetical protein